MNFKNINRKDVIVVIGIRTWGCTVVIADRSTEPYLDWIHRLVNGLVWSRLSNSRVLAGKQKLNGYKFLL